MPKSYSEMSEAELYSYCGDDALKWAEAFQEIVVDRKLEIDTELMLGWFANVMMAEHDSSFNMK